VPLWLPLLVVALALLFAWLAWRHERRRLEAFVAWAEAGGWVFAPEKVGNPRLPYALFERGHSRYLRFAAEKRCAAPTPGLDDVRLRLFEYHYAVTHSTGKSTHTQHHEFTCALLDPGLDLGHVGLRREGLGDKLVQALGFDDIDLEDPEFSKRYVVAARERRHAYELLDGPMMRYLALRRAPNLETRGREVFLHAASKASPQGYDVLARFVLGFLAQLPRPLVNAERVRRGQSPLMEAGNASSSSRSALEHIEGGEA
jgi:hypothetical protein